MPFARCNSHHHPSGRRPGPHDHQRVRRSAAHQALDVIEPLLQAAREQDAWVIMMGDFNLHDPLWNPPGYLESDVIAQELIALCMQHGMVLASEAGLLIKW